MRHAIIIGATFVLAGCAGSIERAPETETFRCPTEPPPELYALPDRRLESVTPDDYDAERDVIEGRHDGFAIELRRYANDWGECGERHTGQARPGWRYGGAVVKRRAVVARFALELR